MLGCGFTLAYDVWFTADDILKLHFMKHTKVVVMETAERVQLSVPFSSYLKFSVLYDPTNNLAEARQGFK